MFRGEIQFKVKVDRLELLAALKKNRETHEQMYVEARKGYIDQAKEELEKKLKDLEDEKNLSLVFSINPPIRKTEIYDTAIDMLKWSKEERIELTSDEFRNLVKDEWEWVDQWLLSNVRYSSTVETKARSKGLI